jgi:uncharacterized RDD family membrane protein YckC
VLDLLVVGGLLALGVMGLPHLPLAAQMPALLALAVILFVLLAVLESTLLQSTPGKWVLGLKTTDRDGVRLGFLQGVLRSFVKVILGWPVSLVLLLLGRPPLHDRVARSIVLQRGPGRN